MSRKLNVILTADAGPFLKALAIARLQVIRYSTRRWYCWHRNTSGEVVVEAEFNQ